MIGPGSRLGQYEIVAPLGAGGMGEVFRARDTRLGREVALKLVLEVFLGDHDRLARFEREARTLASLNHPGIATLHGLEQATPSGSASPVHFLVMELVEGETLAERIARRLTLEDSVSIARQITEALEAAHEKGIIHRDLKPANVKITPDDKVKVLDFGLAKAVDAAGGVAGDSVLNSPTMSAMATAQGMILGTAAYMSPEQARGAPADHRSDIFSFGIVLYEMLTGRHPFPGETVSDVLASVLAREPDLSALPQDLSPRLIDLVRRCLEKQPKRRWQAIGDVRHELEIIAAQPRAAAPPAVQAGAAFAPRPMWRRAVPVVLAALIAGGITAALMWTLRPAATPAMVTRFPIALGDSQILTSLGRPSIAVSPDGKRIAYIANLQVWMRALSEFDASPIKATDQSSAIPGNIAFSPDGLSIAYWQAGQIKTVEIAGGAPVTVCATDNPAGISWSGDSLLFAALKGIMRVPARGGQPELIVPLDNDEVAFRPQMLAGGNTVLFTLASGANNAQWETAKAVVHSLETGTRTTLVEGASDARYVPSGLGSPKRGERGGGHLVYAVSGVVFARAFDASRLSVIGGAVSVVEGVRRGLGNVGGGVAHFSVSETGTLAYIAGPVAASATADLRIGLFDRQGVSEVLNVPPGPYSEPRMSPDGRTIVFGRNEGRAVSIWVYQMSSAGSARRLTFGGQDRYPVWTADSQRVVFQSDREGDLALFSQRADGTDTAERLTRPEKGVAHIAQSASPDGAVLLVDRVADGKTTLMTLSLKDRTLAPFGGVESLMPTGAVFSPDGRWVAYAVREPGASSVVFVQPFPATGAKSQVSANAEDGHHQIWSSDGKELFYNPGPNRPLTGVIVNTTRGFAFGAAPAVSRSFMGGPPTVQRPYDAARDGKRFLGLTAADGGGAAVANQIHVVLNWFDELRARAPVK